MEPTVCNPAALQAGFAILFIVALGVWIAFAAVYGDKWSVKINFLYFAGPPLSVATFLLLLGFGIL